MTLQARSKAKKVKIVKAVFKAFLSNQDTGNFKPHRISLAEMRRMVYGLALKDQLKVKFRPQFIR